MALFALNRVVTFHMQGEVVGAGETALTHAARERLGTCVLADVTCKFVGARKTPWAVDEVTLVRLFPCVDSLMSFQMRAFCVCLSATGEVTEVNATFLEIGVVPAVVFDGGTPGVRESGAMGNRGDGHHDYPVS